MNILAIDYGSKNIGLAWVQTGINVVLPFGVIVEKNEEAKVKKLKEIIKKEGIDLLVVGLPLGLNGAENDNTKKIRSFAEKAGKETGVPVKFENEIFTSRQADRVGKGVSRDEKSAMIILQSYLDRK